MPVPGALHGLGIKGIRRTVSMSNLKYDAIAKLNGRGLGQ